MMKMKKRYLLVLTIIPIIAGILFAWFSRDRVQPVLDTAHIPTAEYLMQNVESFPVFIGDISPDPGNQVNSSQKICVGIMEGAIRQSNDSRIPNELVEAVMQNTEIFVNSVRIPRNVILWNYYSSAFLLPDGRTSGETVACFTPQLESGLHIAEVRISDRGQVYSYSWAYEVK